MINNALKKTNLYLYFIFFTLFQTSTHAEGIFDCLDSQWMIPKGEYIQQICDGYDSPHTCPASMDYDAVQDRLSISFNSDNYEYNLTVDHACLHVNRGFDLKVKKTHCGGEGTLPRMTFYADGQAFSKLTSFGWINENKEPYIAQLTNRGKPGRSCRLKYSRESSFLSGACDEGGDLKNEIKWNDHYEKKARDGVLPVMSYLSPLAYDLFAREIMYKVTVDAIRQIDRKVNSKKQKQKKELWFYPLLKYLNWLPDIDERTDELSLLKASVVEAGFDADHFGSDQGFALQNIYGELRLQRCIGDFTNRCQDEDLYPELVQQYCEIRRMSTTTIHKAVFCHDPEYSLDNITLLACDATNMAVDSHTGLLMITCEDESVLYMERAMTCLDNQATFVSYKDSKDLLACQLDYAVGVKTGDEPEYDAGCQVYRYESDEIEGHAVQEGDPDYIPASSTFAEVASFVEKEHDELELPVSETHKNTDLPADDESSLSEFDLPEETSDT